MNDRKMYVEIEATWGSCFSFFFFFWVLIHARTRTHNNNSYHYILSSDNILNLTVKINYTNIDSNQSLLVALHYVLISNNTVPEYFQHNSIFCSTLSVNIL